MLFSAAIKYGGKGLMKLFLAPEESKFILKYVDNCLSMFVVFHKRLMTPVDKAWQPVCHIKNTFTD